MIMVMENGQYMTKTRGTTLVLEKKPYGWQVSANNAAVQAWRSLGVKIFNNLEEVEARYKSFRGIKQLLGHNHETVVC